jgi:hypothetical protein
MSHIRYIEGSWGDFYATGYGLIAHDSASVTEWLAEHQDYNGGIWFNYADGSGEDIDVTEIFMGEDA